MLTGAQNVAIVGSVVHGTILLCGFVFFLLYFSEEAFYNLASDHLATFFVFAWAFLPTLLLIGATVPWMCAAYDSMAAGVVFVAVPGALFVILLLIVLFSADCRYDREFYEQEVDPEHYREYYGMEPEDPSFSATRRFNFMWPGHDSGYAQHVYRSWPSQHSWYHSYNYGPPEASTAYSHRPIEGGASVSVARFPLQALGGSYPSIGNRARGVNPPLSLLPYAQADSLSLATTPYRQQQQQQQGYRYTATASEGSSSPPLLQFLPPPSLRQRHSQPRTEEGASDGC